MRAFLSVSDKTGIVAFAKALHEMGVELISTGGTAKTLQDAGISVTPVSDVTGFPECLDGRVKTLHPHIHAGILAMRHSKEHMDQLAKLNIQTIDLVIVNLYPFQETIAKPNVTLDEAIENIDIGGPTMLRAAAKNWQDVTVLVDAADYDTVLAEMKENDGKTRKETRLHLAAKVFSHTAAYDALIAQYLTPIAQLPTFPDRLTLTYEKAQDMRYGENPHQQAVFYREIGARPGTLVDAEQLHGKELSYNNINDANGALDLLREFSDEIAVVASKHANPCGVAVGQTISEAYTRAYEADPVSVFGGIVAANAIVDRETALEMKKTFLEIVIAPDFTPEALEILREKKNLRLLKLPSINQPLSQTMDMRKVAGGLLMQDMDLQLLKNDLEVVTQVAPTDQQIQDLLFAWKIVKHTKSNAIAIAKDGQSLGIAPGQVNRIWATQSAIERSGDNVRDAALASDAYFPFDDCVRAAAAAGIGAIIQPGGSVRDADSIAACNEFGIPMVFTGMRHFKH